MKERQQDYFFLLLYNLPLETVKSVATKNGLVKPSNTTLDGFFKAFFIRYRDWLGENPSLSDWQNVAVDFLVQWCPPGQKNGFKWDHATKPDTFWTLSHTECRKIAFVTTFQFATAVIQYWPYKT